MYNNGDFFRTTCSGGFEIFIKKPLGDYYEFKGVVKFSYSTLGIITSFWYHLQVLLGFDGYHTSFVYYTLVALFFSPLIVAINKEKSPQNYLAVASFFLLYLLYGFYFRSFYEEAAVLAFAPLLYMGVLELQKERYFAFSFASFFIILSKIQMIFIAPMLIGILLFFSDASLKKTKINFIILVIIAASFLSISRADIGLKEANQYNRYYNGIGWSLQKVYQWDLQSIDQWPDNTFMARKTYFYRYQNLVQQSTQLYGEPLLGTTYWPTFYDASEKAKSQNENLDNSRDLTTMLSNSSFEKYLSFFAQNPYVIIAYIKNIFAMTLISDYSLSYYIQSHRSFFYFIFTLSTNALRFAGYAYFAFFALILLNKPHKWSYFLVSYYFLGAPIFTVMGDGFYEFEKHMNSYLILLPVVVYLGLSKKK